MLASCLAYDACSFAQESTTSVQQLVRIQSQDIELPEDFMARVDGNKLQIALVDIGVIDSKPSTASMLVRLLNPNGEERVAIANSSGIAEFDDVKPNEMHAILVADENAHAAVPIMTVSTQQADRIGLTAKNVKLSLMPANRTEILASINRDLLPPSEPAGEVYASEAYRAKSTNPYRVQLQPDNRLLGRVIVADRDLAKQLRYAKLTFLKNNQVVARVDSDTADGAFEVPNIEPGIYGVIAAGPAGYASFAFDVLPAARRLPVAFNSDGIPVSTMQTDASNRLYVFLCPPKFVPTITDRLREIYRTPSGDAALPPGTDPSAAAAGSSMGANGFAGMGGYGGGGGFIGGGGGGGGGLFGRNLGGILGVAGLATVAGILAAEDDNQVTSPITP
jgi:uncharacterized membrane protein YgcG